MPKTRKVTMIPQEKYLPCYSKSDYDAIKKEYEIYGNKIVCYFEPESYYGLVEVTTYRMVGGSYIVLGEE